MKYSSANGTPFRVRPFQREDGEQVKELFKVSIAYEAGSSRRYALRGSLTRPNSLLCYSLFIAGLYYAASEGFVYCNDNQHLGAAIKAGAGALVSVLSLAFFIFHRRALSEAFKTHADPANHPDLTDIGAHYGVVTRPKEGSSEKEGQVEDGMFVGKSGFWVAELLSEDGLKGTGKIVGCVGLDDRMRPGTDNAELRRMAVSSTMQRRGVGRQLLEAVLNHVQDHNIKVITLQTTAYSPSARGIYEKFGWKWVEECPLPGKWWLDFRLAAYSLTI